jgi:hypothetical protein
MTYQDPSPRFSCSADLLYSWCSRLVDGWASAYQCRTRTFRSRGSRSSTRIGQLRLPSYQAERIAARAPKPWYLGRVSHFRDPYAREASSASVLSQISGRREGVLYTLDTLAGLAADRRGRFCFGFDLIDAGGADRLWHRGRYRRLSYRDGSSQQPLAISGGWSGRVIYFL